MKKFSYDYIIKTIDDKLRYHMDRQFERDDNVIDMSFVDGKFGEYVCDYRNKMFDDACYVQMYIMTIQSDEELGIVLSHALLTGYNETEVNCVEVDKEKPYGYRSFKNMFEEGFEI